MVRQQSASFSEKLGILPPYLKQYEHSGSVSSPRGREDAEQSDENAKKSRPDRRWSGPLRESESWARETGGRNDLPALGVVTADPGQFFDLRPVAVDALR